MNGTHWYIRNEKQRENAIKELRGEIDYIEKKPLGDYGFLVRLAIETGKRTTQQNNALHKYCQLLADCLNEAGQTIRESFLGKEIELQWDTQRVKERLWRGTQIKLFGIESTTDLDRKQVSEVYETINRFTAENFGIHVAFPERERG